MTTLPAAPGDVLAVWTSASLVDDLIRVGEAPHGLPAVANHQVGYAHPDLGGERRCQPADWRNWSDRQLWRTPGS